MGFVTIHNDSLISDTDIREMTKFVTTQISIHILYHEDLKVITVWLSKLDNLKETTRIKLGTIPNTIEGIQSLPNLFLSLNQFN